MLKKLIIIFLSLTAVFASAVTLINFHILKTTSPLITNVHDVKGKYDCILVLGCGVRPDNTPSLMLNDRLRYAVELYDLGLAPKIIMSGDHGTKEYDEVNVMKNYALEHGVPEEDIFMDHAGFSTYESMYRAKEIFQVSDMLVVTQEYHLYRALYICERLGLSAYGIPCDNRTYYGQTFRDIREILARCKDFFTCILKPEPTFLGDVIPVSGDGTVTAG